MGEFSYTEADNQQGYGQESYDYSSGYQTFDPGYVAPAAGFQDEVAALIPEGTPMLAAILMEQGVLDQNGLHLALQRQAETGDTLTQVLLDEGLAAPDQLMTALQTRAHYR